MSKECFFLELNYSGRICCTNTTVIVQLSIHLRSTCGGHTKKNGPTNADVDPINSVGVSVLLAILFFLCYTT